MGQLTISQHWSIGPAVILIVANAPARDGGCLSVSNCHALLTTRSFQLQLLLAAEYWPKERQNCEYLPAVTSLHNSNWVGRVCVCRCIMRVEHCMHTGPGLAKAYVF